MSYRYFLALVSVLFLAQAAFGATGSAPAVRAYYLSVAQELKDKGVGRPVVFVDLDRLDQNIATLKRHLTGDFHFRVVEKSLPSIGLLKYVMEKAGTNRVMAFHHPFLKQMLTELPPDTDFLFGKTVPAAGVREVLRELSPEQKKALTTRVHWLIDSKRTLTEYLDLFRQEGMPFNASIEIDVGLHRGGATSLSEFGELLALIQANPSRVQLTGLMGYDGHVSHVPFGKLMMGQALNAVIKRYRAFRGYLERYYPKLCVASCTFDGAGSETYTMYRPGAPINDFAVGSALLKPRDLEVWTLSEHVPALFIATPVLKKLYPARLPFIGRISLNPKVNGYYIYGGGWSEEIEYPHGIHDSIFTKGTPNRNLVSNQSFLFGHPETPLEPGDFVFYRAIESDQFFLFDELLLMRGGKIVGSWKPFERRY